MTPRRWGPVRGRAVLWIAVALLLLAFAVRAHNVLALPAFNDESLHIRRSEVVWTFEHPDTSFTVGKLLGYYWLGAFGFDRLDALAGGRLVYALIVLPGAAATYRVGRALFRPAVGALALLLYAVAPPLVFYERLILADQLAATFSILALWASIRLARRPTRRAGLLAGLCVSLAVLAKLTAIPIALLPLVAVWTLGPRDGAPPDGSWRGRLARFIPRRTWPALATAYGFNLISGLPFMLFPLFRELADEPVLVVGTDLFASSGWARLFVTNLPRLFAMLAGFCGPVAVIVALLLAGRLLFRAPRPALLLLAGVLLPWGLILALSPDPSNRYWLPGLPPLLVLVAAGLWDAAHAANRRVPGALALGVTLIWIALVAAPFAWHAWTDPTRLALPARDRWEYFENFASGYGLREASAALPGLPASTVTGRVPVVGLVGSCHQLRLLLPEDGIVDLTCPFFGWEGEHMDDVVAHIQGRLAGESVLYLLVEPELPFTDLSLIPVRWEPVARFPLPFGGMAVELYRVAPRPHGAGIA